MEIDARLIKFNEDISPNINSMNDESKSLIQNLNSFCNITDSVKENLEVTFKTDSTAAIEDKMSNLSLVAKMISDSIFSELDLVLDKCRKLSSGVWDLEALLDEYKMIDANANQSEVNSYEKRFFDMQEELLKLYNEILNADLDFIKLDSLSKNLNGVSLNSLGALKNGESNLVFEKDGAFYQKSMPIFRGKRYDLDNGLNIIYNNKNMVSADKEAGLSVVKYLKDIQKKEYGNDRYSLWNYQKSKYSNTTGIASVMNRILEDTYTGNKCSSFGEYASVAATVLSQGPVNLKYGISEDKAWNHVGFDMILQNGSLSNAEFMLWCYKQAFYKKGLNYELDEDVINNIILELSKDTSNMSFQELCNLEIGSSLYRNTNGREKIQFGMIIGYTKINNEPAVVIAQALSNKSGSYCNIYKVKDCFGKGNNKWQGYVSASILEKKIRG